MFLAALSLSFISKTLSAIIMKGSITQIERRFDISSSTVGLIDGSFEMGNLLVILFVSYFGAKLHRPKLIGIGCFVMGIGSWEKESGSHMWIYILLGNMLRGIGETPITPLGISYIDDFAKEGHSSFYLGTIRITPKDSRWVGAWWLGFLVAGIISIISSIPFFFLPKNLDKPRKEKKASVSLPVQNEEKSQMAHLIKQGQNVSETVAGFFQSLKNILTNPLYVITLVLTLLQASSHIGIITYVFKYVEQQYGQSASETSILFGFITIPTFASGVFTGGYIIKKFKFTLVGIAKFSFCSHMLSFLFHLLNFALICENKSVAGLTLTYDGF
ncbi:hypothetical protein EI555_001449, partial [Monodon monoceros]